MVERITVGATPCLRVPGPGPVILFLPGNPGVCEFYEGLVADIAEFIPEAEVIVPSHLGFGLGVENSKVWTLDEQVQNCIFLAREVAKGRPLYIFGHSVGAWMAQRAAMALEPAGVGLVAPTIMGMPASEKGRTLVRLGSIGCLPWLGWALATVLGSLPSALLNWALSFPFGRYAPIGEEILRQSSIVYQVISLGLEEMERIVATDPPDATGFWESGFPVWAILCEKDPWVPTAAQSVIRSRCTNSLVADIRHSFVLSSEDTRLVAQWIADKLNE